MQHSSQWWTFYFLITKQLVFSSFWRSSLFLLSKVFFRFIIFHTRRVYPPGPGFPGHEKKTTTAWLWRTINFALISFHGVRLPHPVYASLACFLRKKTLLIVMTCNRSARNKFRCRIRHFGGAVSKANACSPSSLSFVWVELTAFRGKDGAFHDAPRMRSLKGKAEWDLEKHAGVWREADLFMERLWYILRIWSVGLL